MSYNNYDFRVSQSACVKALEGYLQMETLMESEKETLLYATDNTDRYWSGKSQRSTKGYMRPLLNSGIYDSSYKKVKKMHICLEKALPQINLLLARCEGFVEQLQHDIYVEPSKPAEGDNRELNGGILALNYEYVSQIRNTCDTILEENEQITMSLTEVLHNCEELLGGTDKDMARLTAASDKVKRIENYKNAFQAYASGVIVLELDLESGLREIIDGDGGNNPYEISGETAAQMAGGFTDYDNISVVQMFATEIFKKDVSEWSEEEIDFIARTWDDAVQNGKTDFIELYTKEMFIETYTPMTIVDDQIDSGKPFMTCDYQFESDEQKIELIMSHLDPKTQGLAYYTLNRLNHRSSDVMAIYGYKEDIQSRATHNIEVTDENGTIQIKVSAAVDSVLGYGDENFDFAISLCDMNEIIDARKEADLEERLQFSPEQIEQMRMSAVTDADVEFLDHLTGGEYEQAFDVHPRGIGPLLIVCLTGYILQLEDINASGELEKLINGALVIDPHNNPMINDTSGQYINMIRAMLLSGIEVENVNILCVEYGGPNQILQEEEIDKKAEKLYKQFGLWTAIEKVYYYKYKLGDKFDLEHQCRSEGTISSRISNLSDGDDDGEGYYNFHIHLVANDSDPEEPLYVLGSRYINVITAKVTGEGLTGEFQRIEIEQLRQDRTKTLINGGIDATAGVVNLVLPGTSATVAVMRVLVDGGYDAFLDAYGNVTGDFPYDEVIQKCEVASGVKLGRDELETCLKAYCEVKKIDKEIQLRQQQLNGMHLGQGVTITFKLNDENGEITEQGQTLADYLYGTDIILPQTQANINKLYRGGLRALLKEMGYDDIEDIIENIRKQITPGETEKGILYGGIQISEIPPEELEQYISEIQSALTSKGVYFDFRKWLRGEKQSQ